MPLFCGAPQRTIESRTGRYAKLAFDDCDEAAWAYTSVSRAVETFWQKVERKFRVFKAMTPYARHHVRLQIRNGDEMSLQLYRSDSLHDDECVGYYDLRTLQNVKNVSIPTEKALAFVTFAPDEVERQMLSGGVATTELVYGQIGLRLELLQSVSDGVELPGSETTSAAATGGGGGGIAGAPRASGVQRFASAPLQLVGEVLGDDAPQDGAVAEQQSVKASKRAQKKLERKGKSFAIHLVFSSCETRDEWGAWFRTLLRELELERIADQSEQATTSSCYRAELVEPELVQRITDTAAFAMRSTAMRAAVKDYTHRFMNIALKGDVSSTEPPNKGKVQVRTPWSDVFSHVILSAWLQAGEVIVTPYQPKDSLGAGALLGRLMGSRGNNSAVVAAALSASEQAVMRRSASAAATERRLRTDGLTRSLRLSSETLVCAPMPYSCEFQVKPVAGSSNAAAGAAKRESSTIREATWYFVAPSVELRDAFVNWLRLVKGRGTTAQTERETFPFKGRRGGGAESGGDNDDSEDDDDDSDTNGEAEELEDGTVVTVPRRSRRGVGDALHQSASIALAAARAAEFVERQRSGLVHAKPTGAIDGLDSESEDVLGTTSPTVGGSEKKGATEPPNQPQQQKPPVPPFAEDEARLQELHHEADTLRLHGTPRSTDSVHSIRPFRYFPSHLSLTLPSYLSEQCAPFLMGLGERASSLAAQPGKKGDGSRSRSDTGKRTRSRSVLLSSRRTSPRARSPSLRGALDVQPLSPTASSPPLAATPQRTPASPTTQRRAAPVISTPASAASIHTPTHGSRARAPTSSVSPAIVPLVSSGRSKIAPSSAPRRPGAMKPGLFSEPLFGRPAR